MKKILLFAGLFMTLGVSAQIYSAMDSTAFSAWTSVDLDGDGNGWIAGNINGMSAVSYSYDNATAAALTPNNLFISPAIDLSTGSNLMLNYTVTAIDQSWVAERYAIYIVTNTAAILGGTFPTPVQVETIGAGVLTRNVDISAEADGEATAYIVIRHFECTDFFAIGFDDLTITGDFASVEDNNLEVLSVYPNPTTDILNISLNEEVAMVTIYSLDGKIVMNEVVNNSLVNLEVSELEAGMYFYEVSTKDGEKIRNSFIKQ